MRRVSQRRLARESALQVLYSVDLARLDPHEALRRYRASFGEHELDPESATFMEEIVLGTCREIEELDRLIAEACANWRVSRMAVVDRNLLRVASFELYRHEEIPIRVTLNEAVEIARRFGSTQSRSFVNGVLDRVAALLGRE